jgi:hypothetical protein
MEDSLAGRRRPAVGNAVGNLLDNSAHTKKHGCVSMKRALSTVVAIASVLVFSSGCVVPVVLIGAGAAGGVGSYAYINGQVDATVSATYERTWAATISALKELEFPITSQTKDNWQGQIAAKNASGKAVRIKIKKISDSAAEMQIRVGTFGDEALSHVILSKVQKYL